jgi:hypothetical protein
LKHEKAKLNAAAWWDVLDGMAKREKSGDKPQDRGQLTRWLPKRYAKHTDLIIEQAATDFTGVNFTHMGTDETLTVPVRQRKDKPLKREMSEKDLSQYKATALESGKRSFFRTWVRAVPKQQL